MFNSHFFDISVVIEPDLYALVSSMDDLDEDVWLYSSELPGAFVLSKQVLGPDEREALGLTFITSTGQLRSGIVLNIPHG